MSAENVSILARHLPILHSNRYIPFLLIGDYLVCHEMDKNGIAVIDLDDLESDDAGIEVKGFSIDSMCKLHEKYKQLDDQSKASMSMELLAERFADICMDHGLHPREVIDEVRESLANKE